MAKIGAVRAKLAILRRTARFKDPSEQAQFEQLATAVEAIAKHVEDRDRTIGLLRREVQMHRPGGGFFMSRPLFNKIFGDVAPVNQD